MNGKGHFDIRGEFERCNRATTERLLALEPIKLGMEGACHVAAKILRKYYPNAETVAFRDDQTVKHIALREGDRIIDISGIRHQREAEAAYKCLPSTISLETFNYEGSDLFRDQDFLKRAEKILSEYIDKHPPVSLRST